ncbi:NAD(P)/FAD-dependent oxidoreductase [Flavobacterium sp. 3HN19-14]|uniref:NAD(P)/FAD-dependent oxidoreductase n=1 Tax=Flavobacterium sp. 3HN19-14 TaxID=3448133 RepID=UPI003EE05053
MKNSNVIIIGGGLAGLTAAIHLSRNGLDVTLIEKNSYPKHKVCGEYISNEVLPYLDWLGLDIATLKPVLIKDLEFSTVKGNTIKTKLPIGGFGVSRYALDNYLYENALSAGCNFINGNVENIAFENDNFKVITSAKEVFTATIAIGAFGKRSNIDHQLHREFIEKKSPWLAVKAHYSGNFSDEVVGLHNFKGGYCGVSKVEDNAINICWLANFKTFRQFKNIDEYQKEVLCKNPNLKVIFEKSELLFDKPLTISQISFDHKKAVDNHILMIGDTAGLIHPLCGNGMAMAIHSAKIASELILDFTENTISRATLEKKYFQTWNKNFSKRIKTGQLIARLLQQHKLSEAVLRIFILMPFLLQVIIKRTHGKPIQLSHAA